MNENPKELVQYITSYGVLEIFVMYLKILIVSLLIVRKHSEVRNDVYFL